MDTEIDFSDDSLEEGKTLNDARAKKALIKKSERKNNKINKTIPVAKPVVPTKEAVTYKPFEKLNPTAERCRPISRHLSSKIFTKSKIPIANNHKMVLKKQNTYLSQFYEKLMHNPSSLNRTSESLESLCGSSVQSFNSLEILNENTMEEENLLYDSIETQISTQKRILNSSSSEAADIKAFIPAVAVPKAKSKFSQRKIPAGIPTGESQILRSECTSSRSHFLKKYNHNNNKIGYLKTKKGDFSGNEGNSEIQDNIDEINTTTMTTNQNKKINEIAHPQDLQKKALNSNEKTGRKKSSYLEKFRQRSGKL